MKTSHTKRDRLSVDVLPEEHRKIKAYAALHGKTIREYILECVRERLSQETESKQLSAMTSYPSPVLKEIWDNEKDAAYDKL